MAKNCRHVGKFGMLHEKWERNLALCLSWFTSQQRWLITLHHQALYELTDVLENEKYLMAMWNEHMRHNPIKAAAQLTPQLVSFVRIHSEAIFEEQLEDELLKHLTNMWVEGHIRRDDILHSMKIYNSLVDGRHYRRSGTRTHISTYWIMAHMQRCRYGENDENTFQC